MRSPKPQAFSYISRTTDLGDSSYIRTIGWLCAYVSNAASSRSASGFGHVMSSRRSMRSSYSMPSAFISAIAAPRALCCCAMSTGRGSSRIDSMTLTTSTA